MRTYDAWFPRYALGNGLMFFCRVFLPAVGRGSSALSTFLDRHTQRVKNGETLKVKKGCYTMKGIEKVSSGKVKYDSFTGKSIIDSTISRFGPYMNKILGISNGNYFDTLR